MTYFLSALLASAAFLLVYYLFLANTTMHHFKRWYLLLTMVLSNILPGITIYIKSAAPGITGVPAAGNIPADVTYFLLDIKGAVLHPGTAWVEKAPVNTAIEITPYIIGGYALVCVILLARLLLRTTRFRRHIKKFATTVYNGETLTIIPNSDMIFSYYNIICIGDKLLSRLPDMDAAIAHERSHIQQKHTLDVLLAQCIRAIAWANPFMLWYVKAIRLNHEFLADRAVLYQTNNTVHYQQLLLQFAHNRLMYNTSPLAGIHKHSLKKRFIMMSKKQTRLTAWISSCIVLVLAIGISAFSVVKEEVPVYAPGVSFGETYTPTDSIPPLVVSGNTASRNILRDTTDLQREYFRLEKQCLRYIIKGNDTLTLIMADYPTRLKVTQLAERMTKEEKKYIGINLSFIQILKPVANPVKKDQFEQFKNAQVYGVWIDGAKVSNEVLNRYKYNDFKHVFVSKLYGAAKKGRSYQYQVDLSTPAYFKETWRDKKEPRIAIKWAGKNSGFSRDEIRHIMDSIRTAEKF